MTHKQALKVLAIANQTCTITVILQKHELLNREKIIKFADCVSVYKLFHALASPPLQEFIEKNSNGSTRTESRGDCAVLLMKSVFRQTIASQTWNSSAEAELSTLGSFTKHLKIWFLGNQNCFHNSGSCIPLLLPPSSFLFSFIYPTILIYYGPSTHPREKQ